LATVEQLIEVQGIGPKTAQAIKDVVGFERPDLANDR
jgi:Holliday junction resolvasome RuvABC DNA-binding subunit